MLVEFSLDYIMGVETRKDTDRILNYAFIPAAECEDT